MAMAASIAAMVLGMAGLETSYADSQAMLAQARNRAIELERRDRDAVDADVSGLADPSANDAVRSAHDGLDAALGEDVPTASGASLCDPVGLWRAARADRQAADDVRRAGTAFHDAVSAQTVSYHAHSRDVARDGLSHAVDVAREVVSDTEGRVHDDALRRNVTAIADESEALADATLSTPTPYDDMTSRLQGAVDALRSDSDSWQREARTAADRRAATSTAANATRAEHEAAGPVDATGTWYASYRGTDDDSRANSDGSLSEWRDGYFIAHSWSKNGREIASRPEHVVIDGRSYHYVSSMTSSKGADSGPALAFARQNGGIAFQTCTGGNGVVINHYEPD